MKTSDELLCATALHSWKQVVDRATRTFESLDDEQLLRQVAPGRNSLIYVFGHLTVAHDRMLPLLRIGDRTHAELDAAFFDNPEGTIPHSFPSADIRAAWKSVNNTLTAAMELLSPKGWLERHSAVDESSFQTEPLRNRFAILLSRTNHLASHLGQVTLAR